MKLDRINLIKLGGLAAFVVLLYWALQNPSSLLGLLRGTLGLVAPFLVGGCIAFILNVPMRFFETKLLKNMPKKIVKLRRALALVLALLAVVSVVFVVLFLLLPELGRTARLIGDSAPHYIEQINGEITQLAIAVPELGRWLSNFRLDWNALVQTVVDFVVNDGGRVLNSTFGAISSVLGGVFTGFLGFVFSLYVLLQKETLGRQARRVIYAYLPEERADTTLRVAQLSQKTFSSFLSGQCAEAVILGTLFFVAMSVLGFPYALLVGVLIGFTALIPIFGAFIGCAVGTLLILMVNPIQAVWFVILFLVLQQLEGNLIYPRVVGSSVGLPSIWVLVAVTIGGSAMGVVGMLVFIPLCSVLYALLREAVNRRIAARGISPDKLSSGSGRKTV